MKKILDSTFQSVDTYIKHAPEIITRLSVHKNKTRIKQAIDIQPPIFKICAVKFIKDLFDEALFYVIELVQQLILPIFHQVILYREEVKQFNRGNTFLLSKVEDSLKGQDIIQLMSKFITPSKTYFQLVHQCIFYWAKYIEQQNSPFKTIYESIKHCIFPTKFKYFKQNDDITFKDKYKLEQNAVEYELEDCFTKWQQTRDILYEMERKDYSRQKLESIYNWIQQFVTQYTNLLIDLKTSHYYQRKGFKQKMLALLVQQKEFLKLYIECLNKNSFKLLYLKYGKQQEIDEQFEVKKSKKTRRKKIYEIQDQRLTDIKKIYLANYLIILNKFQAMPIMLERNKHYVQYKKGQLDSPSRVVTKATIQRIDSKKLVVNSPSIKSPSDRLKSSLASHGKSIINGNNPISHSPSPFIILPLGSSDNRKYKLITQLSAKRSIDNDVRSSLNNNIYRSQLLNQRRNYASVCQLPKNIVHEQKSVTKSKQKSFRLYKVNKK